MSIYSMLFRHKIKESFPKPEMQMPKVHHNPIGVLFDFYDTLVEEDRVAARKWNFLNEMGYECSSELQAIWDPDGYDGCETPKLTDTPGYVEWRDSNIEQLAMQSGVPQSKLREIVPYLIHREKSFTVRAKTGAVELIRNIQNLDIPVGICSNWDDDFDFYLDQTDLPRMDAVVTSAEVGARKPHPKPFITGCTLLGTIPSRTIFVGDSWTSDITGAIRVGMIPVWLSNMKINPAPRVVKMVQSLDNVLDVVLELSARS